MEGGHTNTIIAREGGLPDHWEACSEADVGFPGVIAFSLMSGG